MSALVQFALDLGVLRVPICRAPRVRRAARVVVVQYVLDLGLEPCERVRPTRFPRAPRVRTEIVVVRIGRRPGSRARRESDASYVSWRVEQRLLERGDIEEILRRYQPVIEFHARKGKSIEAREDLVQEMRRAIISGLPRYKPARGRTMYGWVSQVCANKFIDFHRKTTRSAFITEVSLLPIFYNYVTEGGVDHDLSDMPSLSAPLSISDDEMSLELLTRAFDPAEMLALESLTSRVTPADRDLVGISMAELSETRARVREFLRGRLTGVVSSVQQLFDLIPVPSRDSINTGLSPASPRTLARLLGEPRKVLTSDCAPITNRALASRMATAVNVGPFKVTGERLAVESLRAVLDDVLSHDQELYDSLGSAGMLCCRLVRGSHTIPSNHSWGTAIDIKIAGRLDPRGDAMVQRGLLKLYSYFHRHGWWWGAEFRTEDAMHFELAEETLKRLYGGAS